MFKNRIIYGIVLLMSAIFVVLFEHRVTYAVLYAVLLLPLTSLIILIVSKRNLKISGELEAETVKKNEPVRYTLQIKNNNCLFNFKVKAVFDKKLKQFVKIPKIHSIFIPSRKSGEYELDLISEYRGVFQINADHLRIYDPFGLFGLKIKNLNQLTLTVLPNIHFLSGLPVDINTLTEVTNIGNQNTENYSDFPDFRKYMPADGYKRIHWQLSAKRNELISKNFYASSKAATAVIINNSRLPDDMKPIDKMRCEDNLIEAAVAVIAYCNALMMPVYLDYIGNTRESSSLDFNELYIYTSSIEFNSSENFDDFLAEMIETRRDAVNIFVITHTDCVWFYDRNIMVLKISNDINIVERIKLINEN